MIETPALLNMVKHCCEFGGFAQGYLMGVMLEDESTLHITQTIPKTTRGTMTDIWNTMENEEQKLMDTNEIGFFMNCNEGNIFSKNVLNELYASYRKFKNSIFLVYD